MEKKVLILEDEKEIAQLYAKCLNAKGYATEIAYDGIEGLKKLKEFTPHLILMDVNMPNMSGLEFYQHICDAKQNPKYPVLVLTGRADLEMLFKDFQVDGILIKPFEASRLFKEVDIILNKHHWGKTDGRGKTVVIVEDVHESANKIYSVFAKAGYKTEIASSGVSGIEKMMTDPPDLCIVKLGLIDIPGDRVILRLEQIAKTRKTSALLYTPKSTEQDKANMERIADIKKIKHRLEYDNPTDLLSAANKIFQELEKEAVK